MSIYRYWLFNDGEASELETLASGSKHSIRMMRAGVDHLYVFRSGKEAAECFDIWRRQPCERISLELNGVPQPGGRLPLNMPDRGRDMGVGWNGEYDTDGEPCPDCQVLDQFSGGKMTWTNPNEK